MIVVCKQCQCTAKPDPRPWNSGNRSGITYRVSISDGKSNLDLRCKDNEVYNKFEPYEFYQVALDVVQAAQEDRMVERVNIVDAVIAGD